MYKAQDMVNEGRSAEDVISTTIIDSSVDLAVGELSGKVVEGGANAAAKYGKIKLPSGAASVNQLGEFSTILNNSEMNSNLGRAALTYQAASGAAGNALGELGSGHAQNAVHDLINNTNGSGE